MARGRLSEDEVQILRKNPYVSDVEETKVIYTNEFKFLFMKEYLEGKKPTQIFKDAGFDPRILGSKRIERAAHRWRKSYATGSLGNCREETNRKRRKWNLRDLQNNFTYEKCLEILNEQQERINALEAENERLRKKIALSR